MTLGLSASSIIQVRTYFYITIGYSKVLGIFDHELEKDSQGPKKTTKSVYLQSVIDTFLYR